MSKTKEKKKLNKKQKVTTKKSEQNNHSHLNLDNEIVIGLNPLPEPPKQKKKRKNKKEDTSMGIFLDESGTSKKKKNIKKIKKQKQKSKKEKEKKIHELEKEQRRKEEDIVKKPKKKSKLSEKQINKRRKILVFTKWSLLIIIILGGITAFLLSPIFNMKKIEIIGSEIVSKEEITSLSQVQPEVNLFKIFKNRVVQNIKQNAYIDSVKIKRKLPDTLEITVIERKPTYQLEFGNSFIYLNNQGYLLESSTYREDLVKIIGYKTEEENLKVGRRICKQDLESLEDILKIMENAEYVNIADKITAIKINSENFQDPYIIIMQNEGKEAHIGDLSNIGTKMLFIQTCLEREKGKQGDIYLNVDLNKRNPYFREKV